MTVSIETVSGDDITPWLDVVARLRIKIFRDWPYLYEGREEYEQRYLQKYIRSDRGIVVLALAGGTVIGASTGLPLVDADDEFSAAFQDASISPAETFYFGESVLQRDFRGQGIGRRFFDERESHARAHGFRLCAFCAVKRPEDHPLRYRPLDDFWRALGYEEIPGAMTEYRWTDLGDLRQSAKPMQFWSKSL